MRRVRFLVALLAVAAASNVKQAAAMDCPSMFQAGPPYYTCGYRSGGPCICQYECTNGYHWFNFCDM